MKISVKVELFCELFGVKFTKFWVSAYVTIPKIHGGAKSNRGPKSVTIFVRRNFWAWRASASGSRAARLRGGLTVVRAERLAQRVRGHHWRDESDDPLGDFI